MKRAKSKVIGAPFLQRDELLDDVDDLSSVKDPFYGRAVDHGVKIGKVHESLRPSSDGLS